jgi:uncharacterized protein
MTTIDKHPPGTICWVDLMTTDAEQARNFYSSLLGWTFVLGGPETGHYAMAHKKDLQVAGVGQIPPGAGFPAAWSAYFASPDLDATIAQISEHGGTLVNGPMDILEEGRMAICSDPTGAVFGVWQPKRHVGARLVAEPGAMCWHEVNTRDAATARDFYCKVFGLEPQKVDMTSMGGPPTEFYTLHRGPDTVCGVVQMTDEWAGVPPHWIVYFAVESLDAAVAQVGELGGKLSVPPFDTPYGRMAVCSDPAGAAFSVIQLSDAAA